ncbi:MAG: hypothetical protein JJU45_18980 [Acidimicrobiia bacterium]|nr:hypothetical protein [Acidimicrobiia bacterium]
MSTQPTSKQVELIATLSRRAGFDSASDAAMAAGLTDKRGNAPDVRYDITRSDASDLIDQLKAGLTPDGGPDLSDVADEHLVAEVESRGFTVTR